jgi:hypothetical protein
MARAQVTHSQDAVQITFGGDRRRPEPSTAVIKFPGGHVEISRCSDGTYWAHLEVVASANIADSRIEYEHGAPRAVKGMPDAGFVRKMALRISNMVPHFDPDA